MPISNTTNLKKSIKSFPIYYQHLLTGNEFMSTIFLFYSIMHTEMYDKQNQNIIETKLFGQKLCIFHFILLRNMEKDLIYHSQSFESGLQGMTIKFTYTPMICETHLCGWNTHGYISNLQNLIIMIFTWNDI